MGIVRARRTHDHGQQFGDALRDHDVQFPSVLPAQPEPPRDRQADFGVRSGKHGPFEHGRGWSPVARPPVKVFRGTSREMGGIFPFLTAMRLPKSGANLGVIDSTGTGFFVDTWQWVQQGLVSNPNILFQGKPGQGKSGTSKALVRRTLRHGGRCFVPGDLKNEYAGLCREWGQEPWEVAPGFAARINPLDAGPLGWDWASLRDEVREERWATIRTRWLLLLRGLLDAQGVRVTPIVEQAIAAIVDELTGAQEGGSGVHTIPEIVIPQVHYLAANPTPQLLQTLRYSSIEDYWSHLREMVAGLSQLVHGALRGMFDGPTTVQVDWNAPIQSVSMRRLKELADDSVIGVALTCANSWVAAMTAINRSSDQVTIIPRDEVWRVMRLGVGAIKSLDSNLRLSRDERKIEMIIMHKPSDLASVGAVGSEESEIAKDFWALCDTKVSLGHAPGIAAQTAAQWGLSEQEELAISSWAMRAKGRALWRIGDHSFRVRTMLTPYESETLFNTNDNRTDYGPADESGVPAEVLAPTLQES